MGQNSANSTGEDKLDTYDKHRVGDLMFAHSTTKNYHPGFPGPTSELVQITDVLHDVDYETRRPERVEIHHVTERTVSECGAEHGDVILDL